MFYIHQSNQVEILADNLSQIIEQSQNPNPFAVEVVLVQSPGMSQWLKIFLAQRLGVMGNIEFPLPSSYIWSLYQKLIDDLPEQSAFNKADMAWKLFGLLPQFLADPQFLPLNHYLAVDENALMRFQLCEKIADVFDQYLMYRPDWIAAWDSGQDQVPGADIDEHPWQPKLWRALSEQTQQLGQSSYHRANLQAELLTQLAQLDDGNLPQRLFIFGISALPSQQLQLFSRLAEQLDIHLMLFNPCEHYWGDIVDEKQLAKVQARFSSSKYLPMGSEAYLTVGNPLLASWGKLGRDYLEQLLEVEARAIDCFVEPEPINVLSHIQGDIFNLSFREQIEPLTPQEAISDLGKQAVSLDDRSLVFNSCHSPLREIEVLHDTLLKLFEQDPKLSPKDVIVMMPDVSAYSPYIDAVFAGSENHRIPYAISDKGIVQENPIINSFLQLMKLPDSRFTATELLDLISVPATIAALELEEQDIELIRHWIEQVGIRWGIDSAHKRALNLPDDELNSWRFGLNRMLLGYAVGSEQLVDGILPFTPIEGKNAEILGKLLRFMDILIDLRSHLALEAALAEKIEQVSDILDLCYLPKPEEAQAINHIRQVLQTLQQHQEKGNYSGTVSQTVFSWWLNHAFDEKGVGQRFLAGQVNFCTLMPMRSIPFKVICLLGMNDADYPRFVAPVGFDLMANGTPRKGDRSRRHDDRYLLLEALLSARQKLYISYIGRSLQDNSERIPSVLITELLEYCQQRFIVEPEYHWLTEHPLQPFNPAYFRPDSALYSYQAHWFQFASTEPCQAKTATLPMPITDLGEPPEVIETEQLLRFLLHPVKYFFNHTLQLHFADLQSSEIDDEAFSLDALTRYQLLQQLTSETLAGSGLVSYEQLQSGGALPHSEVGKLAFDGLSKLAENFVDSLNQGAMTILSPVEVNLTLAPGQLLGWVKNMTSDGLLFYRPAKANAKDRLTAWFYHVLLSASAKPCKTRHFGLGEGFQFAPLEAEMAKGIVAKWMQLYQQGLQQPLPFFVKSSEQWALKGNIAEVAKVFNGSSFNQVPGEGDDLYIRWMYQDLDNLPEAFAELADTVYQPLLKALEDLA